MNEGLKRCRREVLKKLAKALLQRFPLVAAVLFIGKTTQAGVHEAVKDAVMAEEVNAIAKIAIDRVQSIAAEKHLAVQTERFKKARFSDEEAKEMAKELMFDFELEIVD